MAQEAYPTPSPSLARTLLAIPALKFRVSCFLKLSSIGSNAHQDETTVYNDAGEPYPDSYEIPGPAVFSG